MSEAKAVGPGNAALKPDSLCLLGEGVSGASSPLDTPGDSGVLCLDSESDLTNSAVLMTTSLAGAEELTCDPAVALMTRSDIDNRNVADEVAGPPSCDNLPDVVLKALESEGASRVKARETDRQRIGEPRKSLSEDIVFRRKCKKKNSTGSQKKRVSFHEDILNNTKTDNIRIDHGFVSYNLGGSYCERFRKNYPSERFSWCATSDNAAKKSAVMGQQSLSDILCYSDTDKSGVFEYTKDSPTNETGADQNSRENSLDDDTQTKRELYGCESNSSDSNLSDRSSESSTESTSSNSNETCTGRQKCDKAQKSSSCDCFENDSRHTFMRRMYFSEADIDQDLEGSKRLFTMGHHMSQSPGTIKSVLKKKRYIPTNVVEEIKKTTKKGLKIPQPKNIFDSLRSFYQTFKLSPVKGLPEGMEDSTTVIEAIPCESRHQLSKSLDSGFHVEDEDDFVEINLYDQPSQNKITMKFTDSSGSKNSDIIAKIDSNISKEDSPRTRLRLNMTTKIGEKPKVTDLSVSTKYVINCESTVYEHKGSSFCYMHDSYQNAFDTPKEQFVPIPDKIEHSLPKVTVQSAPSILSPLEKIQELPEINVPAEKKLHEETERSVTKNHMKYLQEEGETRTGIAKHLASPKKQNVSRYDSRASTSHCREDINCNISDGDVDNSTLKGGDDLSEDIIYVQPDMTLQKENGNKATLLQRYLKSVCQNKDLDMRIKNNEFLNKKLQEENRYCNLVYPMKKVSKDFQRGAAILNKMIEKEITENKRVSVRLLTANEPSYFDSFEDNVAIECSEKLRLEIFTQPRETLHRMLKVRSPYKMSDGSWRPLMAFVTDHALYVAEVTPGRGQYDVVCCLPHHQLDAIVMGPDSAYVRVIGLGGRAACTLVTGDPVLAQRLVCCLEWAARTSLRPPPRPPAALSLSSAALVRRLAKQRLGRADGADYYGHVCSGSAGGEDASHRAPRCDGYLMFKPDARRRWEPSYFLLKSGVLSWGPHSPDTLSTLPRSISLGAVLGVRRYSDPSRRPHCFELALAGGSRMLLAAPDEPTASTWLQALLLHAAQFLHDSKVGKIPPKQTGGPPPAFTLLVTETELLCVRETLDLAFVDGAAAYLHDLNAQELLKEYAEQIRPEVEIVTCGTIKNLTAFKIPNNDDNWCVLEWSVCEARERDAGLTLVFASGVELERFIAVMERAFAALTSSPFPLSVVEGEGCPAAYAALDQAWAHMLPAH